jgi:hypothetical protein
MRRAIQRNGDDPHLCVKLVLIVVYPLLVIGSPQGVWSRAAGIFYGLAGGFESIVFHSDIGTLIDPSLDHGDTDFAHTTMFGEALDFKLGV